MSAIAEANVAVSGEGRERRYDIDVWDSHAEADPQPMSITKDAAVMLVQALMESLITGDDTFKETFG